MTASVSFASFNLYNFQSPGKKVHGKIVTQSLYDKKKDWTVSMLKALDADVVCFQELWSRQCLDEVLTDADLQDYTPVYITDSISSPWYNIAVAAAVRKPWSVKSKKVIKAFPFQNIVKVDEGDGEDDEIELTIKQFSRSILKLTLENLDDPTLPTIIVFAMHLKSKLPSKAPHITAKHRTTMGSAISTIRRTAEAAALRWLLTNHMKNTHFPTVVVGDLNDDPRSNTLALITQQPRLDAAATGGDAALYSCLQLQQLKSYRDVFYTHEFNRLKDTIDHVLVSEEFFANSKDAKWQHVETRIWNDYLEDERKHTSDHGIIKASFKKR